MKLLNTFFLLSLSLIIAGCTGSSNLRPSDELIDDNPSNEDYYIKPGDVLNINVWGEPKLSGEVVVRDDGRFTLPLADDIEAEGKTLLQLKDELETTLNQFVPGVSVSPSIVQSAPIKYFMAGQFIHPGEFRSELGITLLQAVAKAGGFAPFADESEITLIRKNSAGELRYQLDYNRVVTGKEPNPKLKDGDFISVQ